MLSTIKRVAQRTLSTVIAFTVFLFMLPLTLGMMVLMLVVGFAAKATLGRQLKKYQAAADRATETSSPRHPGAAQKQPIEGSYTIVNE